VHPHLRAEKKFGGQIYREKFVSAPQAESAPPKQSNSPIFEEIGEIWAAGEAI